MKFLFPGVTGGCSFQQTPEHLVSTSTWLRAVFFAKCAQFSSFPHKRMMCWDPILSLRWRVAPCGPCSRCLLKCGFKHPLHIPQTSFPPSPGNGHIQVEKLQEEGRSLIFHSNQREWNVLPGEALLGVCN